MKTMAYQTVSDRELNIIYKNINELIPYEKNPRRNDIAVEYVEESIKKFGFKVPIIIDKNNVIVAGHTRYMASKKLNLCSVPCIVVSDLTDEQIKAFRIVDNKSSEKAEWDNDRLNEELKQIISIDMRLFDLEPTEEIDLNTFFEESISESKSKEKEVECPFCNKKFNL